MSGLFYCTIYVGGKKFQFPIDKYPLRVYIVPCKQIPHEGILRKERQPMSEKKACPCCSEKHTARSEEEKKKLINRLKRIEGQIRGIIGMMENDAYCNDILIQSAAVNAAVNSFNKELLATHIRTCVARDIREGKDETIDELVATLQKLMK